MEKKGSSLFGRPIRTVFLICKLLTKNYRHGHGFTSYIYQRFTCDDGFCLFWLFGYLVVLKCAVCMTLDNVVKIPRGFQLGPKLWTLYIFYCMYAIQSNRSVISDRFYRPPDSWRLNGAFCNLHRKNTLKQEFFLVLTLVHKWGLTMD